MMQVTATIFDQYILSKFVKVARLATSGALDNPIWSSIIFEAKNQRILYIGWHFSLEVRYPVEEDFIVNFFRFRDAVRSCKRPTIRTTKSSVIIEEDNVKFKLKKLDLDYSNFLQTPPENLQYKEVEESLLADIQFCSIAASKDRMEYTKYGVILGDEMICAMDSNSSVAIVLLDKPVFLQPILLHLPWCEILQGLGAILEASIQDLGGQNALLYINTKDDFRAIIPVLKVNPNPSMIPYIKSIEPQVTIYNLNRKLLKRLEITADDAYKFITVYSNEGKIYLETTSKVKGKTTVELCEGEMGGISVAIASEFLYNVVSMAEYLDLDLENNVGIICIGDNDEYKYVFSLG